MAPSSTRMRSAAIRRSSASSGGMLNSIGAHSRRSFLLVRRLRPQSEQVADGVDEVGAVHGVEMKVGNAAVDEVEHLLGSHRGSDELARRRIVIETVEALGQPTRHAGAGARGEAFRLLKVLH